MTGLLVHRHFFTVSDVARTMLGEHAVDCMYYEIQVRAEGVLIDIVDPSLHAHVEELPAEEPPSGPELVEEQQEPQKSGDEAGPSEAADEPEATEQPDKPKGGPHARRSAILCGEKTFQVFIGMTTKEDAAAEIYRRCGITSRALLDHDDEAAVKWEAIDGKYRLWMEGYDV